jgi:hypothetical protein
MAVAATYAADAAVNSPTARPRMPPDLPTPGQGQGWSRVP